MDPLLDLLLLLLALVLFAWFALWPFRILGRLSRLPRGRRSLRVPLAIALTALMTGVAATLPSAGLHDLLKSLGAGSAFIAVSAAPLYEEAFKAVGAWAPLRAGWRLVRSRRWGLGCGALAGLGFGLVENLVAYPAEVLPIRTVTCLPLHVLQSALVGLGVYYALAEGRRGLVKLAALYLVAVLAHGAWNWAGVRVF